jgi:hypothetical protein
MVPNTEIDLGGFLLPWTFVAGIIGFVAAWLTTAVMESFRLTRYVWHLPLFFVGVACLIAVLLALLF